MKYEISVRGFEKKLVIFIVVQVYRSSVIYPQTLKNG
jgi:hypothetical protein